MNDEILDLTVARDAAKRRALRASQLRIELDGCTAFELAAALGYLGVVDAHSYKNGRYWFSVYRLEWYGPWLREQIIHGMAETLPKSMHKAIGDIVTWYESRVVELDQMIKDREEEAA